MPHATNTASGEVPIFTASPSPSSPRGTVPPYVLSYFAMRRAAGWIGIFVPIVAAFLTLAIDSHHHLPDSISASYYTIGRNYFVGSLCAVGVFLISGVGYNEDRFLSFLAGAMAFVVAFSPCSPPKCYGITIHGHSNVFHGIAATLLFADLAWMCLFRFTLSGDQKPNSSERKKLTAAKKNRNVVFRLCGLLMVFGMAVQVIAWLIGLATRRHVHYLTYGVETLCLMA